MATAKIAASARPATTIGLPKRKLVVSMLIGSREPTTGYLPIIISFVLVVISFLLAKFGAFDPFRISSPRIPSGNTHTLARNWHPHKSHFRP